MTAANDSCDIAEQACAEYISGQLNVRNMLIQDFVPASRVPGYAFHIQGGQLEQTQNYQFGMTPTTSANPPGQWFTLAFFLSHFLDRKGATETRGILMNSFPVYKNKSNSDKRGLAPNLNLFEMQPIPEITSAIADDQETTLWMCFAQFRVQFGNKKT